MSEDGNCYDTTESKSDSVESISVEDVLVDLFFDERGVDLSFDVNCSI